MKAIYAGSFDPPTLGHYDIIRQAKAIFGVGEVYVVVARNASKGARLIDAYEAARLVAVDAGVFADVLPSGHYVAELYGNVGQTTGQRCLVRGLRDASDMGPEIAIRRANEIIAPTLPTVYFLASPEVAHVSSTAVRALVGPDGWERVVARYVTPAVLKAIKFATVAA